MFVYLMKLTLSHDCLNSGESPLASLVAELLSSHSFEFEVDRLPFKAA